MKRMIILGLTGAISFSAISEVNCRPFIQEVDLAQTVVADFEQTMTKLSVKVRAIEEQISDREKLLVPVIAKLSSVRQNIAEIESQLVQLNVVVRDLRLSQETLVRTENDLVREINRLQITIDDSRISNATRRTALRDQNRARKNLERVQLDLAPIRSSIQRTEDQITLVGRELNPLNVLVSRLEAERSDVENLKPSISFLIQKRDEAQRELDAEDLMRSQKMALLNTALERELMCNTYNVKYPTVFKVAKEVERVGCGRYTPIQNANTLELDAEAEILKVLCP